MIAELEPALAALAALAPLRLAGDWDNVGLLVEGVRPVRRIGLCIDLTEAVWAELAAADVDLVVAYHPPLFGKLTALTAATPRTRVLLAVIRAGVHVYSPHTALDAAHDGMTDWLVGAAGPVRDLTPIAPDRVDPAVGAGRIGALVAPVTLADAIARVKVHLGLAAVRVASAHGDGHALTTVAACPGAGGSVLDRAVDGALARGHAVPDLLITGELRHHDVLRYVGAGASVIVADHSNTERAFLPILAGRLGERLGVDVIVSAVDADPLSIR